MFDESYNLSNRPFLRAIVNYFRTLVLRVHLLFTIAFINAFPSFIPDEYKSRLKVILWDLAISLSYLMKRDKFIIAGIVNENNMLRHRCILFENVRKINDGQVGVDIFLKKIGLLSFLFFEDKGFKCGFWAINVNHNFYFFLLPDEFLWSNLLPKRKEKRKVSFHKEWFQSIKIMRNVIILKITEHKIINKS